MTAALLLILGAILSYLFGRWQAQHTQLSERRIQALGDLFERFEDVDQKFYDLIHPFDPAGTPDKKEKARLAAESFNDLQAYYRRNSIWLTPRTGKQFDTFIARYRNNFRKFTEAVTADREDRKEAERSDLYAGFVRDSPVMRTLIEAEFRAALGFWSAWISVRTGQLATLPAPDQDPA